MPSRPTLRGAETTHQPTGLRAVRGSARRSLLLVIGISVWCGVASAAPPRRIVSLNLCTDQLLLLLAPERIAALSALAADPLLSVMADQARAYPRVRGDAEEVLRQMPDLIVAAPFAARDTVNLLRRLGRPVHVVELGQDIAGLERNLRDLGRIIDATPAAEAVIAAMQLRLARVSAPMDASRPSALVINFGGLSSGAGSLADTALRRAGFRNASADYPANAQGAIPLEAIMARPPDLLVLGQDPGDYRSVRGDNLRHPALTRLLGIVPHTSLPQRLTLCALPHLTEAVALLAAQRDKALAAQQRRTP